MDTAAAQLVDSFVRYRDVERAGTWPGGTVLASVMSTRDSCRCIYMTHLTNLPGWPG
jgi:hypothetical protein